MFINFKYHLNKFLCLLLFILIGCTIQEPTKNHGVLFLENRSNKLILEKTNKNDVLKIIGQPHTQSIDNEDIWVYFERTLTKGKYHKLGRHVLKSNNALVLTFDKYGLLLKKDFFSKDDINRISFSKENTKNKMTKSSFIETLLTSVKSKMYRKK